MSWTELFPVMDEVMAEEFDELATAEERSRLEEWYGVAEVFGVKIGKAHVLSLCLFWKQSFAGKPEYPPPDRDTLKGAGGLGLDLRYEPWPHYIQPVLDSAPKIVEQFEDVAIRVYLAADLRFLLPDLLEAGCEVFVMRHPSLAHAPGSLWRFLAIGEADRLVTVIDSDRIAMAAKDIERTRAMAKSGLGGWRVPVALDLTAERAIAYKPYIGCHLGAIGGWPMVRLLHAFTWHCLRGTIPLMAEFPGCGMLPVNLGQWPSYGFDEWFLAVVMYPRVAGAGLLTFVPTHTTSLLFAVDIEYATWSNANSQLVVYAAEGCCRVAGPPVTAVRPPGPIASAG